MILFKLPTSSFSIIPKKPWIDVIKPHSAFFIHLGFCLLSWLCLLFYLKLWNLSSFSVARCRSWDDPSNLSSLHLLCVPIWMVVYGSVQHQSDSLQLVVCQRPQYLQINIYVTIPHLFLHWSLAERWPCHLTTGNNIYRLHNIWIPLQVIWLFCKTAFFS